MVGRERKRFRRRERKTKLLQAARSVFAAPTHDCGLVDPTASLARERLEKDKGGKKFEDADEKKRRKKTL
jgi:hypothetical protein